MTATARPGQRPARALQLPGLVWVTWRQHRRALAVVGGIALALIVWMVLSRPYTERPTALFMRAGCLRHHAATCKFLRGSLASYPDWPVLHGPVAIAGLMCVFVGALLLPRGFEEGTLRYDWAQAGGLARWAWTRLVALGLASAAALVPLGLAASWWLVPYERAGLVSRWVPGGFLAGAPASAAWAVFTLSLGMLAGAVCRDRVRAMVAGLGAFGVACGLGAWELPQFLTAVSPAGQGPSFWLAQGLAAACLLAVAAGLTAATITLTRRWLA